MTTPAVNLPFKTLADDSRRAIFERLCAHGEQTVGTLTNHAGISQPAVSKHLRILKAAGLVVDRQDGRNTHYRARLDALLPLIEWTQTMTSFWHQRLDRLEEFLKEMDR